MVTRHRGRLLLPPGQATVLAVKGDLMGLRVSPGIGRVKASALALPLVRLAALTRPLPGDDGPPSDRCDGMGMPLVPRFAVAQHGVEDGQELAGDGDDRDD